MGLRVKKMLGYALLDVNPEGPKLDPRFNTEDGWAGCSFSDSEKNWSYPDFLCFWEKYASDSGRDDFPLKLEKMFYERNPDERKDLISYGIDSCLIYDGEFGLPNVFLVMPPSAHKKWYRRDDTIDWTEETYSHNQEPRFIWGA